MKKTIAKITKFLLKNRETVLIIFLDIDGVLHKGNTGHLNLTQNLVEVIKKFEEKFRGIKVKIVISSNWKDSLNVAELRETLPALSSRIIDVTPDCLSNEHNQFDKRQKEIEKWIKQNRGKNLKNFKFLAIDDDKKIFSPGYPHVFFTENKEGLDDNAANELMKVLNEMV